MFTNSDLKKLIIPLVIEQALVMTVGMADTMMVSHAGEASMSGVALVDMIDYLIITIFSALGAGGAVIVSQYLGAKQTNGAETTSEQLILRHSIKFCVKADQVRQMVACKASMIWDFLLIAWLPWAEKVCALQA